jgi:hypothetical protein
MHTVDYIVVGFLIACMIWAGVMALHKSTMITAAGSGGRTWLKRPMLWPNPTRVICSTRYFDRRCHGERVFRIFAARVLIIFPNPLRPRVSPLAHSDF